MSYQRDYEKRVRIGIVGAGSHSYRNVFTTLTFLPVDLRGVCDLDERVAERTARQYGARAYTRADDMYRAEELDAVFICVSPKLHPELTIGALTAGLHVWLEKPPALNVDGIDAMIRARGDKIVVVGFKKAFMPVTVKMKSIFADEKFAPIRSVLAEYPMDVPADGEKVLATGGTPNWLANGVHPLSMMLEIAGPVETLTVHRSRHGGGACVMQFASGAIGNLHLAEGAALSQPCERYTVFGTNVRVTAENNNRLSVQRGIPFQYAKTTEFAPDGLDSGAVVWEAQNTLATLENKALFTQGMFHEMKYFCDCVLTGTPAETGSLEFARTVMQVYEAGLRSGGATVPV